MQTNLKLFDLLRGSTGAINADVLIYELIYIKINNIYCVQIIIKYKEYKLIADKINYINNNYRESKTKVILEFNPIRL